MRRDFYTWVEATAIYPTEYDPSVTGIMPTTDLPASPLKAQADPLSGQEMVDFWDIIQAMRRIHRSGAKISPATLQQVLPSETLQRVLSPKILQHLPPEATQALAPEQPSARYQKPDFTKAQLDQMRQRAKSDLYKRHLARAEKGDPEAAIWAKELA